MIYLYVVGVEFHLHHFDMMRNNYSLKYLQQQHERELHRALQESLEFDVSKVGIWQIHLLSHQQIQTKRGVDTVDQLRQSYYLPT